MARAMSWAYIVLATSSVIDFDPIALFESGKHESDLLVVVEKGKSLGRSPFDKTLRTLDTNAEGFQRQRPLIVSSCRGCSFYDTLMDRWRLTEGELPVAFLFPEHNESSEKGKFRCNLARDGQPLEELSKFVRDFDAGLLLPWVRGPPGPPEAEEPSLGPVHEVMGPTFLQKVVDPDANVLLLLYAPFCGFSKKLQPIFEELGRNFAGNHRLHFARIDTTENELPPSRWVGQLERHRVPRIYLYKHGNKTLPEVYPPDAEQTYASLLRWLEQHLPHGVLDAAPADGSELERGEF